MSVIPKVGGSLKNVLDLISIKKIRKSIRDKRNLENLSYQQKIESLSLLAQVDSSFSKLREAC